MEKYLTKSRFKLATECPTKLFYTGKKEYLDTKLEDDFLKALAEGGFQVGELAKLYYPGGVNIDDLEHDNALKITNNLLQKEHAIIYEAAFKFNSLFIRADIVVKEGKKLKLIEVKAKSYDPNSDKFIGARGGVVSEWKPYIYDIAFQKFVIKNAYPNFEITSHLCLTDKSQKTNIDGLNQRFFLYKDGARVKVRVNHDNLNLGNKILIEVKADEVVDKIIGNEILLDEKYSNFEDLVFDYSQSYSKDIKIGRGVLGKCKSCEFKAAAKEREEGYKSGFHECWAEYASFNENDFKKPLVLDIWDYRRKDELIISGRYFIEQVTREDLEGKSSKSQKTGAGLSRVDRQYLQVEKVKNNDSTNYIDIDGLRAEMATWKYPLNFIDFETTAMAIPFNAGRRPYEQIAFQFSHHKVHEDGTIEHFNEWINDKKGEFPNFQFLRELKKSLQENNGSIFRYSNHENTILNAIYSQLIDSNEPDKESLCDWIKTITKSKSDSAEKWEGKRNMIDLLELVKKYYYSPYTNGSNSLKHILPSILNTSDFIKNKYSQPIYGLEIKSRNYNKQAWITYQNNEVVNPYNLLPPINHGYSNELLDNIFIDEETGIADGGAAMIAYARMQFTEMKQDEQKMTSAALLRYCELDTFAMVILWEAWQDWCKAN